MDNETKEKSQAPDPVAVDAAKYAVEVTDTKQPHPWINRFIVFVVGLIVVIGTFGAVIGTINTVQLKNQNDTLKQEQSCQTVLLNTVTTEQKARAAIAADDRAAALLYARENTKAKTQDDREDAYNKYTKQLAVNDARRAKYPVPTFDGSACKLTKAETKKLGLDPIVESTSMPASPTNSPTSVPTSVPKTMSVPVSGSTSTKSGGTTSSPKATSTKTTVKSKPPVASAPQPGFSSSTTSNPLDVILKGILSPVLNPLCGQVPLIPCVIGK